MTRAADTGAPGTGEPDQLRRSALDAGRARGLDEVGVCSAEPFTDTRHVIEQRRADGLDGGMQFTYRNPQRSTDPSRTLEGVRSLVVGALRYDRPLDPPPAGPAGRVARYANEDHYAVLRAALDGVAEVLREAGHRAAVVADQNAMVDRAVAVRAGIGWYGKNSNVLLAGRGSWFVLGSVLTDAELAPTARAELEGCGTCRRCLDGCPTGAIVAEGVVDARRCLAWHVQMEGDFPPEFRAALGDRIYGCDDCQEVCPPNRRRRPSADAAPGRVDRADLADLAAAGRAGQPATGDWVELARILTAPDAELLDSLGRWYVPRRDPRYLRRNALVALGNVADGTDPEVADLVVRHLDGGDPMLASHAAWAALRLDRPDLVEPRAARPEVADELRRWPTAGAAATMAADGP